MKSTKSTINPIPLPNELTLEIFNHIPTKQLTKFLVLSHAMNVEIKKILIKRFNDVFWNPHRRILVSYKRIWGFKLKGDGILRETPLNDPLIYTSWDSPCEQKETRIYTFDSDTDSSHPFINTFYVTNGSLKTPCDVPEESKGFWSWKIFN